jgi:hypothetical protein
MFKFLKFLFGFIFLLLIVAVVGVFIFIKTFDLNKYKSYAEEIVAKQTGRTLSLNGDAGLKISLIPTLVVNDIALSNASWASPKEMIKAEKIEVSLDILPLLHKELVINTVELQAPEIYLSVNKNGENNWTFTSTQTTDQKSDQTSTETVQSTETAQSASALAAMGIVAKHLRIENAKIVYEDLKNKSTQNVLVNSFDLTSEGMNDAINLEFDVDYNNQKIEGNATTGSVNALLQNKADFPIRAEVKAYGATIKTNLTLNDLMSALKFNGSLNVSSPKGNFDMPAVKLDTDLSGSLQNVSAKINELSLAKNTITGTLTADISASVPMITAKLASDSIDVQTLTTTAEKTASLNLISQAAAAEFVPDTALDLSALKLVNADVKATVKKLLVNSDLSVSNVNLAAVLNNGTLTVKKLDMDAGQGTITSSAVVAAQTNKMSLDLTGSNIILQDLLKSLAISDQSHFGIQSGGKTDLRIKLSGQGKTVRSLVESLDGQVLAVVGESTLQTGSLKYLSGNLITQILNTLNLKTTKNMTLTCAVLRTDLSNGKAEFPKGIVFNADQLSLVGNGSLNLKNDKINMTLTPSGNSLTNTNLAQALTSLLKVSGTVQNPKLTLDSSSVIKNVVGVAAAGPAYLGVDAVASSDDSPCYTALQGTSLQSMFPAPTGVKASAQSTYQETGEMINESISAVTDSAKDLLNALKKKNK